MLTIVSKICCLLYLGGNQVLLCHPKKVKDQAVHGPPHWSSYIIISKVNIIISKVMTKAWRKALSKHNLANLVSHIVCVSHILLRPYCAGLYLLASRNIKLQCGKLFCVWDIFYKSMPKNTTWQNTAHKSDFQLKRWNEHSFWTLFRWSVNLCYMKQWNSKSV